MGKGINAARAAGAGLHADVLDDFKDQLLIVFLKRLKQKYGDDLTFQVAETDDTGQDMCAFKIEDGKFVFVLEKKS
ncbi:MAG: hypothetical protein EPO20_14725 [Betaproteobacteria bacterium]|nr:MAG: hypothetical protein EPO20_14725 [Betaproteobacteria bacterium]